MYLLDKIAQANEPVVVSLPGMPMPWPLPGCGTLAPRLKECPLRYVLRDDVTALCTELAFEDDSILASSIELVRVPAPSLWVEFSGRARQQAYREFGCLGPRANPRSQQRIALLVSSDRQGSRGSIEVCWDGPEGEELSPFIIEFDFGDADFCDVGRSTGASIGINISNHPSMEPLFRRLRFNLRPEWYRYYIESAGSDVQYRQILEEAVKPLLEDAPFFAVFCLLLMSGKALQQHPTDRRQLNNARQRRNRPPLLDHVELSMSLGAYGGSEAAAPSGVSRSSPRLHFVRGHLVRRGDAVFWRTSHMRGTPSFGAIRSRTITLQLGNHPAP